MKKLLLSFAVAALCSLAFLIAPASAQVPQLINYQGRVAVGTVNFDGSGAFKFALVNGDGTATYWSNDGTSTAGSEPTAAVTLTVTKGLYSVLLGDATLPHMTVVPATVFTNADVRLRVWFNDGTNGSQLLTPDQRIAAVGYAMMAGNAAVAQTVPDGAITSAKIAAGAVGSAHIGANAVQAANIAPGSVGTGQLALSAVQTANIAPGAVTSVQLATNAVTGDGWSATSAIAPPSARDRNTVVWTGTEMIVWGGEDDNGRTNDGGRYNPATDTWTPIPNTLPNTPIARHGHTAVWTGTEMIIWGGNRQGGSGRLNLKTAMERPDFAEVPRKHEIPIAPQWTNWVTRDSFPNTCI